MRIAYVSVATPFLRSSWSGIPWYSHREILRRFPDTHVIETPLADAIVDRLAPLEELGLMVRRRHFATRHYSAAINLQLEKLKPDAVVAVAAAHKVAYIDPKWPLIYAADAMFATVMDYYGKYASRSPNFRARGDAVQRALLERVDRVLLGSQWAADSAVGSYELRPESLRVAPMGANLDVDPGFQPPAAHGPLNLLFVGYDWARKGGELVLDIWRELRRRTGDATLNIVGARPAAARDLDGVILHGRLDKTDRDQYERLLALHRQSSFFVMPSRQEAFGIAYCEAAAFGRPAVATRTGGIGTIIVDDETGLVLPPAAVAADYADRILATWSDRARYHAMCVAARRRYETLLNWGTWGDAVAESIAEVLGGRPDEVRPPRPVTGVPAPAS